MHVSVTSVVEFWGQGSTGNFAQKTVLDTYFSDLTFTDVQTGRQKSGIIFFLSVSKIEVILSITKFSLFKWKSNQKIIFLLPVDPCRSSKLYNWCTWLFINGFKCKLKKNLYPFCSNFWAFGRILSVAFTMISSDLTYLNPPKKRTAFL